ncbi:hypothetical protein Mro03_61460 [Microbispora rosea subsp. rosea]|nr:hypothetical protein Mro03_61460 [Microbispora rosea subsp. rosea]
MAICETVVGLREAVAAVMAREPEHPLGFVDKGRLTHAGLNAAADESFPVPTHQQTAIPFRTIHLLGAPDCIPKRISEAEDLGGHPTSR